MSSTSSSSLAGYENNNGVNKVKMKKPIIQAADSNGTKTRKSGGCGKLHLNSLWSLWYGLFATLLQAYTAVKCIKRIIRYSMLSWPETYPLPVLELQASLGLTGAAVLLLPLFLGAAAFKIGNLANDGFKLGRQLNTCSRDPPSELAGGCSLWKHGGPTSAFLHLVISFCLLLPKLLMEARLIQAGFLPQGMSRMLCNGFILIVFSQCTEAIWRTDLDFMMIHRDRLVVLSFMTATTMNTSQLLPTASPMFTTPETTTAHLNATKIPSALPFNMVHTLRDILGHETHENLDNQIETNWGNSVSVEFLNLALALLVYSVRYPAVFWGTNKCLGMLFSFQLLMNGVQTLLAYAGMSILYKIQIVGPWKALPLLKHQPGGLSPLGGLSPFLLNSQVTLALYILSSLLVLSSSLVLYLYGQTRFNSFLNQERERKIITLKEGNTTKWSYFTHCAALCVLVAIGVCNAPLLHDYTVVYRGSLDGAVLACVIGGILHMFMWVVVWLFLTIKQKWIFKLRVTVGRATVRQARSVKLVTDVDLMTNHSEDPSLQPLLVVGNGRTYSIAETSPKKAIMSVIQKAAISKKAQAQSQQSQSETGSEVNDDDGEEQIYWLRPALVTPQTTPDGSNQLCWFNRKSTKHKVTFNESSSMSTSRNKVLGTRTRSRVPGLDEDDGDYATLRELPLPPPLPDPGEDTASEEGKLMAFVHAEHVTYASASRDLVPPVDYEDPSPLLTPEPLSDREETHTEANKPITAIVHNQPQQQQQQQQQQLQQLPPSTTGLTPRCLRRADSGMPHEELTPRSDSISTESSSSPPDPPGSNHSETSSGVHSNESSEQHHQHQQQQQQQQAARRATSVADLQQTKDDLPPTHWRSCSLQRNVLPPKSSPHFSPPATSCPPQPIYGFANGNATVDTVDSVSGIPAVILESSSESTVVIRRKLTRPKTADIGGVTPVIKEEPFGRATNMRMTSFTEHADTLKSIQASSATLPLYPTQPPAPVNAGYPHCSTMPLPQHNSNNIPVNLGAGTSCNVYPRQHSTIPIHHNGVRLFTGPTQNPYIKRLQHCNGGGPPRVNGGEAIYTGINRASGEIYHYSS